MWYTRVRPYRRALVCLLLYRRFAGAVRNAERLGGTSRMICGSVGTVRATVLTKGCAWRAPFTAVEAKPRMGYTLAQAARSNTQRRRDIKSTVHGPVCGMVCINVGCASTLSLDHARLAAKSIAHAQAGLGASVLVPAHTLDRAGRRRRTGAGDDTLTVMGTSRFGLPIIPRRLGAAVTLRNIGSSWKRSWDAIYFRARVSTTRTGGETITVRPTSNSGRSRKRKAFAPKTRRIALLVHATRSLAVAA